MQSNAARAAIAIGAIAVVVVLFVVLSGGDDDNPSPVTPAVQTTGATGATGSATATTPKPKPKPKPPTITIVSGKPVGGVKKVDVKKGDHVRFVVKSDVTDEVHVHGYDRSSNVTAGGQVRFDFPANLEGVFEVELENRGEPIAELRVEPR